MRIAYLKLKTKGQQERKRRKNNFGIDMIERKKDIIIKARKKRFKICLT